ncbi:MAG: YceD family protein [bacterium]|nr:YceD family protein [bacterium]
MITVDIRTLRGADPGTAELFTFSSSQPKLEDLPALRNLDGSGTVTRLGDRYLAAGDLTAAMRVECSRCLKPFEHRIAESFSEEFTKDPAEEQFPAENERLVLDPMFRTVILTRLPEKPLHDPACKGLCPVCGKDLNIESHTHSPSKDPGDDDEHPFGDLKRLKR